MLLHKSRSVTELLTNLVRGQLLPHIGSGAGRSSLAKLILLGELYILRSYLVVLEPYGVLTCGLRPPYFLVLTFGKGGGSGPGQAVSALASFGGCVDQLLPCGALHQGRLPGPEQAVCAPWLHPCGVPRFQVCL